MFGLPELMFLATVWLLVIAVGLWHRAWWGDPASASVSRAYLDRLLGMSASDLKA